MNSFRNYYTKNNKNLDHNDLNFLNWMDNIELKVYRAIGLTLLDLPDETYRIHFDSKIDWKCVASNIIEDFNENLESFM